MMSDPFLSASARASQQTQGAVALMALLILLAVSLTLALGLSFLGVRDLQTSDMRRQGEETFAGAEGCLADALSHLRDDAGYGGGNLTWEDTACVITMTDLGGGEKSATVTATRRSVTRRVRVDVEWSVVQLSGRSVTTLSVSNWREVTL